MSSTVATPTYRYQTDDLWETGITHAGYHRIQNAVQALMDTDKHPSVQFCLMRNGIIVASESYGLAEWGAVTRPMTNDTPVCIFSASKSVTATLVHLFEEKKELELGHRVARYLPKFGSAGKDQITIRQVLNHTAGFPRFPKDMPQETIFYFDEIVDILSAGQPIYEPGKVTAYHATTGGYILAAILHEIAGKDLNAILDEYIRKPLGMTSFTYGLPEGKRDNWAHNKATGPRLPLQNLTRRGIGGTAEEVTALSQDPRFLDCIVPSANLFCTAEESARFYQCLLNGGEWQGQRILKTETVKKMTTPTGPHVVDQSLFFPLRYSTGFMLGGEPFGMFGPKSARAFGHLGFMNILCWADPMRNIAVGLHSTGKIVLGGHLREFLNLLSVINKECPEYIKD